MFGSSGDPMLWELQGERVKLALASRWVALSGNTSLIATFSSYILILCILLLLTSDFSHFLNQSVDFFLGVGAVPCVDLIFQCYVYVKCKDQL